MKALVAATVLLAGLSGCFGAGDDGGDDGLSPQGNDPYDESDTNSTSTSSSTSGPYGNTTSDDGSATGNASDNGTSDVTWTSENRTGSVSGTFLIVSGPADKQESFTVENGTVALYLNLTVEGDDLSMTVIPPDCDEDSCRVSVTVSAGSGAFEQMDPVEGEWAVVLEAEGTVGPFDASYTLEFTTGVAA